MTKLTDASGAVVESTRYGDFGTPTSATSSSTWTQAQDFLFDSAVGRGHERIRLELPAGRIVRPDPIAGGHVDPRVGQLRPGAVDPGSDDFLIRIFADEANLPGQTPLYTFPAGNNVQRTDTGSTISGGYPEYAYSVDLPSGGFAVTAGNVYWISITNDTTGYYGVWGWETSSSGNGSSALQVTGYPGWYMDACDLAMEVSQSVTPVGNPFFAGGRRFDAETGFTMEGRRALDSRAGRLAQRDDDDWRHSLVELGNPFPYAANNPVSSWPQDSGSSGQEKTPQEKREEQDKALEAERRDRFLQHLAVVFKVDQLERIMEHDKYSPIWICRDAGLFIFATSDSFRHKSTNGGVGDIMGSLAREVGAAKQALGKWRALAAGNCKFACGLQDCDPPQACQSAGYSGEPEEVVRITLPGLLDRTQMYIAMYRNTDLPGTPPPKPFYVWSRSPDTHRIGVLGHVTCHCSCGLIGSRAGGYLSSD